MPIKRLHNSTWSRLKSCKKFEENEVEKGSEMKIK
jgi:hypothetical protein